MEEEEEERRMNKCTKRKINLKDVPMCEQNHESSSHSSHCPWFNLSPILLHAPASLQRCGWGQGHTKYQGLFLCHLAKASVT